MKKAVFLDKDGTLVPDLPFNADPALIRLEHGALQGARRLSAAGFRILVVSNQSGVAHGYFREADLGGVWRKIRELLRAGGVEVDGFYYCPHHPDGSVRPYATVCGCRKPEPGLLLRAAREHDIDLRRSWMIGDILHDVEAGCRAGCRTVLIDNGGETEWRLEPQRMPTLRAADLDEAARLILAWK